MFCNQCEQTSQGTGCTQVGVCGKTSEVAALQDLLTYALRGLSQFIVEGAKVGVKDAEINRFLVKGLFSTLTNVDFDPARFVSLIGETVRLRDDLKERVAAAGGNTSFADPAASFVPTSGEAALTAQGEEVKLPVDWEAAEDIRSLQEITLYGLRGVAAYADHAAILEEEDEDLYLAIAKKLTQLADSSIELGDWVGIALDTGKDNLRAMELLDAGNTGHFGHPEPSEVPLGHKAGKCILVSGHDLLDLENLLKATEGKGINIYTHGEMLPAHAYPELKKYSHLYGHYGTAWQNQKKEFDEFPGAILMTTNCIQKPRESYIKNIFATGLVGFPGVEYVGNHDFSRVIERALELPGFDSDADNGSVLTGFARNTVLGVADKVIEGVKGGAIKHFFLVGGCDGAKPGRNYYTDFVENTPQDTVVLTLACGKFRFFDKKLGDIGGIPRLLDVGQCNDAFSAVQIAVALANAFECGVNDLPLSIICSWYEQKAVAILLSLLSLGIKGIRLGPSLPAFVTPNVLGVLVENFDIKPITTVEDDMAACLAG